MEYGKIDWNYKRIRDDDEVLKIKKDLECYREFKETKYLDGYLPYWDNLIYFLNETQISSTSLAVNLYDTMHPLNEKDLYRWQRHARMKIKQLNIR